MAGIQSVSTPEVASRGKHVALYESQFGTRMAVLDSVCNDELTRTCSLPWALAEFF